MPATLLVGVGFVVSAAGAVDTKGSCTGASADLEPAQCAYLQAQFVIWNMTRYGCIPTDPCSCNYPGGDDNYITCEGEAGRNTTVTTIHFGDFDSYKPLQGTIGEDIGVLTDLVSLDLCCNEMNGIIPESITKLTKLQPLAGRQLLSRDIASVYRRLTVTALPQRRAQLP